MHQKVKHATSENMKFTRRRAPFHSTLTKPRTNERLIGSPLEAYCHFQFEDSGELIPVRKFNHWRRG